MTTETSSIALVRTGWALTSLVVSFLVFDGATKVLKVAPVLEACERLGVSAAMAAGIGALLLVCTALYAAPPTAGVGTILLTAYLGGAVAIHVRGGSGPVEIGFAVGFGALVWLGLVLREPRVLWAVLRFPSP
jgi:hypothetical protein